MKVCKINEKRMHQIIKNVFKEHKRYVVIAM